MSHHPWTALFTGLLKRELTLTHRRPATWLLPPVFFILTILLYTLATTAAPGILRAAAPGVLWTSALLSILLSHDNPLRPDSENGYLEQILLSPHPLTLSITAKTAAHWLTTGLPLTALSPLAAILLNLPSTGILPLLLTLPLATAILSILITFGGALTLGHKAGLLTLIIILPLATPTLIFATLILRHAIHGLPLAAAAWLLSAIGILTLTLIPLATAAILRIAAGGAR